MKSKAKTKSTTGSSKEDVSRSYNVRKEFDGKRYTGMQVGRSHKWNYDKGVWRETKVTPDRWEISYHVTKRRAGRAPEGSGAAPAIIGLYFRTSTWKNLTLTITQLA